MAAQPSKPKSNILVRNISLRNSKRIKCIKNKYYMSFIIS